MYPMLVKSYNHLHLVEDVDFGFIDHDCGLSIFQMTNNNDKTAKEIVTIELLDIRKFHVDVKDIKNHVKLWEKHESIFPIFGLLVK